MNMLIGLLLLFIVGSLGKALFAMSAGPTNSDAMVRALTVRIGLSVVLFALLMAGWFFGFMEPHGIR
ncbi:MAG: DUF2909 domain-containing protein [Steroidobacteraceae bacterium]